MKDGKPARWAVATVVAFMGCNTLAGCVEKKVTQPNPDSGSVAESHAQLVAAAKKEGQLTVIALPHDWCGYGDLINGFKTKYGLAVKELTPHAGSSEELDAIRAAKTNRAQAPDVVDLAAQHAAQAKSEGLLQSYKVAAWNSIPDGLKDPQGYWYGDYYGVLVFEVNTDLVKNLPKDWSDLQHPDYRQAIALSGDPRTSYQASLAVYSAGLASGVTGPAIASKAGVNFFADLHNRGNLLPTIGKTDQIASGATPLIIRWDYYAVADQDYAPHGANIAVVVPASGQVGTFYSQAISAFAPHPNAAKLWMEYLYSDQAQIAFLRGFCHPIRYADLVSRGAVPKELAAKFPPASAYKDIAFPTVDERSIILNTVADDWDPVVGLTIK